MTKSLLETDIFNYKTPEFFINMKNIPDKTSVDRKAFVLEEKRKCIEGININSIYIPGGLYFHLNYYNLQGDNLKTGKKDIFLPRLRDNEWVFFNDYDEAYKKRLIYTFFGLRQAGKSEMEASLCLRELSLFKETEAIALFSRTPDKDTFVKKITTAITHGEKFMIVPNIDKDWSKEEIRFGITRVDNTTDLRARLFIYNTQEGKKIQIGSGKTPSFMLMDEIAISPFRGVYDVLEPALLSDSGSLRCSPVFTFTGGEVEKSKDAENLVKNPTNKQFTTQLDDGTILGGRFMSGLFRKDCKIEKKFSDYIGKKTNTWLDDMPIFVSDFDKAKQTIDAEIEEAKKSTDKSTLTLKRIFFPLTLDDVFLTESNNKFPKEAIEQRIKWLENHYKPLCVDFFRNSRGIVEWRHSELKPLTKFPITPTDFKEAPVCIYEPPVRDAPTFTYTIGIDPINNNESNDKIVSLASIRVYKRMLSPLDDFKNQFVCTWAGRYNELKDFHELALMIAEYYNAIGSVLPEASENTLIQYFKFKRKAHFFADSTDLQRNVINSKTKSSSKIGLPPSVPNQRHYMNIMVEEANEEIIDVNDDGDEIFSYGVSKEYDIMYLTEMLNYRGKTTGGVHDGNYDRIISGGCALTLAKYFDTKFPITNKLSQIQQEERYNYVPKVKQSILGRIELEPKKQFGFEQPYEKPKIKLPTWLRS